MLQVYTGFFLVQYNNGNLISYTFIYFSLQQVVNTIIFNYSIKNRTFSKNNVAFSSNMVHI